MTINFEGAFDLTPDEVKQIDTAEKKRYFMEPLETNDNQIQKEIAVGSPQLVAGEISSLLEMRFKMPYIPMVRFPHVVRTVKLSANTKADIHLPDGVILIKFSASNHFLAAIGSASVPLTYDANNNERDVTDSFSIVNPITEFYAVPGVKTISVISEFDGCAVSVQCWQRAE